MKNSEKATKRLEHCGFTSKLLLAVAAICVVALGSAVTASAAKSKPPKVKTKSGKVIGFKVDGVNEFLGIPYAAPPVGPLRWEPPTAFGKFKKPFEATEFGSACTQPGSGSENCLFLNVYTPAKHKGRLPVMVWIHGGALVEGSSDPYDPTRLVKEGVIVVTINYRLGYLGFFAHPAIDAEGHVNGNYGFMDQQFALKWVQENIKAFGGDPDQVTIFGQSAGGQSVYAQLASPLAAGLFERAIAESGSYLEFQDYFDYIVSLEIGETTGTASVPSGNAIAASVGCGSVATASCLRGVSAATLVAAQGTIVYPFVDGTLLTQTPSAAFTSGEFNRVSVISGGNHDEWRYFVAYEYDLVGNPIATLADYQAAELALWGPSLAPTPVDALYPDSPANSLDGGEALGASGTDGIFACPERNGVQLLSKYVTTYAYEFNDENAPPPQSSLPGLTFPLGAYHTAELQYLFIGDFFGLPVAPLSSEQVELSDAMISYWTQFAKTGDPNSADEPVWSPYSASADEFQSLIPPTPVVETTFATDHQCGFWDSF